MAFFSQDSQQKGVGACSNYAFVSLLQFVAFQTGMSKTLGGALSSMFVWGIFYVYEGVGEFKNRYD